MFYVKEVSENSEIKVNITDENTFTICPECGIELKVDISEIFSDGGDLYGSHVYCSKCFENI